jgi:hypothetical protein
MLACRSFCCTQEGDHLRALALGEQALGAGFRSAGLLNNLGYSALKRQQFALAQRYLAEALRRDSTLLPALRNRAVLARDRYLPELNAKKLAADRPRVPEHALEDFDRFILLIWKKPQSEPARVYLDAARLYAFAALDAQRQVDANPTDVEAREAARFRRQRVFDYLQRAFALGANPQPVWGDPILHGALGNESIDELRQSRLQPRKERPGVDTYLSDPLSTALP